MVSAEQNSYLDLINVYWYDGIILWSWFDNSIQDMFDCGNSPGWEFCLEFFKELTTKKCKRNIIYWNCFQC